MHAHLMIRTSLAPGRPSHQRIGGGGGLSIRPGKKAAGETQSLRARRRSGRGEPHASQDRKLALSSWSCKETCSTQHRCIGERNRQMRWGGERHTHEARRVGGGGGDGGGDGSSGGE